MSVSFAELQTENRELHDQIIALQLQLTESAALLILAETTKADLRAECSVAWERVRELRRRLKTPAIPAPRRASVKS
jgi:hypothetical protein